MHGSHILQNKAAYDKFTNKKVKFDGQDSAVAISAGASADVAFKEGMAVFTQTKGVQCMKPQ